MKAQMTCQPCKCDEKGSSSICNVPKAPSKFSSWDRWQPQSSILDFHKQKWDWSVGYFVWRKQRSRTPSGNDVLLESDEERGPFLLCCMELLAARVFLVQTSSVLRIPKKKTFYGDHGGI